MNMEVINKIETQISELENRLKKTNDFIGSLVVNIKNLRKEKKKSEDESNVIVGAIQAFKGVLAESKSVEAAEKLREEQKAEKAKRKESV